MFCVPLRFPGNKKKTKIIEMFRLHPTAKMFFCLFFLFASVWYCRWEKNARNWCILQKKYKPLFFFLLLICNCPNSSMFFQIKLLFVRFCFLPKENTQKKEKKTPFLLLVTLAFFLLFFLPTVRQTRKAGWSWKKTQN